MSDDVFIRQYGSAGSWLHDGMCVCLYRSGEERKMNLELNAAYSILRRAQNPFPPGSAEHWAMDFVVKRMDWISIKEKLPPERAIVMTKIDDGKGVRNEALLARIGNLWFRPDMSMYVYYAPTHWRYDT